MGDKSGAPKTEPTQQKGTALVQLPLARVKRIIKTDSDIKLIGSDAVVLIAKATELFLEYLVVEAYNKTKEEKRKILQYKDLARLVRETDELEFLDDMIPEQQPAIVVKTDSVSTEHKEDEKREPQKEQIEKEQDKNVPAVNKVQTNKTE